MTPIFDDDLAHLRGNAMAHDVALDDGRERAPLVPLITQKTIKFGTTGPDSVDVGDIVFY